MEPPDQRQTEGNGHHVCETGPSCSSVVERPLMVRCVVRSIHRVISHSIHFFTTGVYVPWYVLSMLLIKKSRPCSGFPVLLSDWSFTDCLTRVTVNKMC